jgi:hypothetical protein
MSRSKEKKPRDKKEKKEKKVEEETPAKLLDDLFRKTKATPCIYWLPLNEEQIKKKEEEAKVKEAEREKRLQKMEEERRANPRNRGPVRRGIRDDTRSRSRH